MAGAWQPDARHLRGVIGRHRPVTEDLQALATLADSVGRSSAGLPRLSSLMSTCRRAPVGVELKRKRRPPVSAQLGRRA
jgi:hypothetical protein